MVDFLLFPLAILAWLALAAVALSIGGEMDRQRREAKRSAPSPSINTPRIARYYAQTAKD